MPADYDGGQNESLKSIVLQRSSIVARCTAFDAKNPEIYAEFCKTSFAWLEAGLRGFSATTVLEMMRFKKLKQGKKLAYNRDFVAVWVRRLIAQDRRFSVVFHPRKLRPRRDAST
jgi:hypothetical protein